MTKIKRASTLVIGDTELNCTCKDLSIEDLNITHVGLNMQVLEPFDIIIYSGSRGTKIIKSKYTKTGVVG